MNDLNQFSDEMLAAYLDGNLSIDECQVIGSFASQDILLNEVIELCHSSNDSFVTDESPLLPDSSKGWASFDATELPILMDSGLSHFIPDDNGFSENHNDIAGYHNENVSNNDFLFDTPFNDVEV